MKVFSKSKSITFLFLLYCGTAVLLPAYSSESESNNCLSGEINRRCESDSTESIPKKDLVSGENFNLFCNTSTVGASINVPVKKKSFSLSKMVGGVFSGKKLTAEELLLLSKSNIAILIDKSSSMNATATNFPTRISRWNWCAWQMQNFGRQTDSVKQNVDLLLFDNQFVAFPNVNLRDVGRIFFQFNAGGGTDVTKPLAAVFEEHFRKRDLLGDDKNLLVVVITDCGPNSGYAVTKAACERIKRPDEIKVTYINASQLSSGSNPNRTLLPALPVPVEWMPFDAADSMGLGKALVAILKNNN